MISFTEVRPTHENYWRSIILFGRNVATYKLALAQSLLELAEQGRDSVTREELAEPYARHLCKHLATADRQGTFASSRFLAACRRFNAGEISPERLREATVRLGFGNVLDAFHVVHGREIPLRFFAEQRTGHRRGIRLTEDLLCWKDGFQRRNLPHEIEARWRLVETAWGSGTSERTSPRQVPTVGFDPTGERLVENDFGRRRRAITGCRDALNGYQKGKCFYCFADIAVERPAEGAAGGALVGVGSDIDHFFPYALKPYGVGDAIDGVWNLVLACRNCNRGPQGKFSQVPDLRYLERLHTRNQYLVESRHALRQTLVAEMGLGEARRRRFLQEMYRRSKELLVRNWAPAFEHEPAF